MAKPWLTPAESIALYADKRTFSNPTAQRALYFFFDPREGDSQLVIGADGLPVWDDMNKHHNPNYSPALNTQEYLITVQVGHKVYPDTILFPFRARSQLSVADKTHRIASRYLIQSDYTVPFEVIDEAAHVERVFLPSSMVKTTLSSLFLNHQDFQIILSAAEQTANFTLLGDKSYLNLTLTPQQTIDHLHLAAQQVEIRQAQGINGSSRLTLDCQVKSFIVTLRGDLTVKSCGDTLSWQGTPAANTTNILYTKLGLCNSTADALYQIQLPPEISAFPSLLQTLRRQLIHNATKVCTSFGSSGYWLFPRSSSTLKQLSIQGQLDQQNATLILEETQSTLIRFTTTLQPEFMLVEHDTVQTNTTPTLRLQRAEKCIQYAQLFFTDEEGTRVKQGLELLATLPPVGRGAVLILQSSQGYPEIHRFPNSSQCITLNGLHYQVGPGGKLYAVGAIDGRITADRLLRYNNTERHPVGLSFPTALNASQLALDKAFNRTLLGIGDQYLTQGNFPGLIRLLDWGIRVWRKYPHAPQSVAQKWYAGQPQAIDLLLASEVQSVHTALGHLTTRRQADRWKTALSRSPQRGVINMRYLQQQCAGLSDATAVYGTATAAYQEMRSTLSVPPLSIRALNYLHGSGPKKMNNLFKSRSTHAVPKMVH